MFWVSLGGFAHGVKDMLAAYVSAFTVHEYLSGQGTAVGGGDGNPNFSHRAIIYVKTVLGWKSSLVLQKLFVIHDSRYYKYYS